MVWNGKREEMCPSLKTSNPDHDRGKIDYL